MGSGDREKVLGIIRASAAHAFLATCDGDRPTLRSITAIVEDDMSVWIATSAKSRKVAQIKKNPNVCFAFIAQPEGEKAATICGKAVIVSDSVTKERVWKLAPYDIGQHFPGGPGSADYCVLRIEIAAIEWRDGWAGGTHVYEPGRS
jgi:general stress protein 26